MYLAFCYLFDEGKGLKTHLPDPGLIDSGELDDEVKEHVLGFLRLPLGTLLVRRHLTIVP